MEKELTTNNFIFTILILTLMELLLFIAAVGIIALKVMGRITWSWVTVGLLALAFFILPSILNGGLFGTFLRGNNSNTNDPLQTDGCGCGPTQTVAMSRRNMWGNWKNAGTAPCTTALSRVADSGRWRMDGCVN